MYRLLWQAFSTYVKEKDMLDAPLLNTELAENSLKQCRQGFADKDVESIVENQSNLLDCMPPLNCELQKFVQMSCQDSMTFAFWWQYLEMVFILLRYIRAERNGLWELHQGGHKPGKLREFEKLSKSQGKLREIFRLFYKEPGKLRGNEKHVT